MLKVGLVGAGYWGKNLIRNFVEYDGCVLKSVCDVDEKKLSKVKKRYPGIQTTRYYLKLVRDKEIDAIVIATNVGTHFELAKLALENGKHVFIEKPMARTSEKAAALVRLANKNKLVLSVGHTFLYSPPVLKIKDIIQKNGIGKLYYISSSRVNLGIHRSDVSVVYDLAPHDFSILFFWLDEVPTMVSCVGYDYIQRGIPDVAFINLAFASGVLAHIEVSWLAPSKLRRTTIVGEKKMILYDDTNAQEKVRVFDKGVEVLNPESFGEYQLSYRVGDIVIPRIEHTEPLANEVRHFCECIKTGKRPRSDGLDGFVVVNVLQAAERSLRNGGRMETINWGSGLVKPNGNGQKKMKKVKTG